MAPVSRRGSEPKGPPEGIPADDPVLLRRASILKWCDLGQRVGYTCFAAAMVLFVIGFVIGFPATLVSVIVGLMIVGSIVLLPAIILNYAAKAADKEDRGEPSGY